ncbi:hypothetical protein WN943_028557 [Citrus x changshan-huyou]
MRLDFLFLDGVVARDRNDGVHAHLGDEVDVFEVFCGDHLEL